MTSVPGPYAGGQRADGGRRQDLPDAERAQRPQVRPVRDAVRREPVVTAVPGQERDPPARHLADHDGIAGQAERGFHRHLVGGSRNS